MRLQVLAVGRLKAGAERDLVERYRARSVGLARGLGFSGPELVEMTEGRGRRVEERRTDEAGRLGERAGGSRVIVLDETAPSPSSEEFAARLRDGRDVGLPAFAFIIGGPDGLDLTLRQRAEWSLSFGRLTLPHQIVRALLLEQIYRALTIIAGHPYHRGGGEEG